MDRASVRPTCRTVGDGGSLCLLLTAQYPVLDPVPGKAEGRPLILQGSYPAGAPGGAWSKVWSWSDRGALSGRLTFQKALRSAARNPYGNGNGREIEGLVEKTGAECWQCLQEERGRAGSQQRSQESEFEGHVGPGVWT